MKQPQYIQQPFQPRLPSSLEELLRDNKTLLCFTEHPTSMDIDWDNFDEIMEDLYQDEKEEHTDKHGNVEDFIPNIGLPRSKLLKQTPSFQEVFDLAKEVIPNATLNDVFVDLQELKISGYIYYTYTCYYAFDRSAERIDRLNKQHEMEMKEYNKDLEKYNKDLVLYNEYLIKYKEYEKEMKKERLKKELEELDKK